MNVKFLGAAGTVTGSCFLLTGNENTQVLIDFGMFQGPQEVADMNYTPLSFKPSELSAVFLTHAHLDHCGRLPLLVRYGYKGKIYMTRPSRDLVALSLRDAANVAIKNKANKPLFSLDDVEKLLEKIVTIEYDTELRVKEFTVLFRDAGHILGSASVEIIGSSKIVFSGDLGNTPEDIIRPTTFIKDADYVVMESTYGDSLHTPEDVSQILKEEIVTVEHTRGVLLIPAFSMERTQELLHRIHHLKKDKIIREDTAIFLDSPLGIKATEVFEHFREFYNDEMASHNDDPFSFPNLYVTEDARESRKIRKVAGAKVIIAGSGMMSGGRILHHAKSYLARNNTRILFVGYQAEDTLGRKILEGAKSVVIDEKTIQVRAKIREIDSLSSHADQTKLLDWIGRIEGVKKVFLLHGEEAQRNTLAGRIQSDIRIQDVVLPLPDQVEELI